ncbi:MAG: LLM class flavin-dependent oxidoreductase, partial [Candidatus Binatia bacterium]
MWTQERFRYDGFSFSMPERAVLPKPIQKPHPPLWVTVTSPGTEIDAADRGIGSLGVAAASYAEQERRVKEYHRRIRVCDPVSEVVNDRVATLNFLYCHDDVDRAAEAGLRLVGAFFVHNQHLLWTREAFPTRAYQTLGNLAPQGSQPAGNPGDRRRVPEGLAIGDPKRVVEAIRRWESIGVDGINFLVNTLEVIPQQEVLNSMRLFAREVMPAFRKGVA